MKKPSKFLITIILIVFIVFSCDPESNPMQSNRNDMPDNFPGQLESDFSNSIIKPNGDVWSWGSNFTGQLGVGRIIGTENPVQIEIIEKVIAIDLIDGAAYAADIYGNIWFWGNRLIWKEPPGFDTTVFIPQKISFLPEIKQMQVLGSHINILQKNGDLWQLNWNHNFPTQILTPSKVGLVDGIQMISNDLVLMVDGSLRSFPGKEWVTTNLGGLGNSTIHYVVSVQNVHRSHTIILKQDSTVWAWGENSFGCLGNGKSEDSSEPIQLDTLKSIISISANAGRCLALQSNGSVWFWGLVEYNSNEGYELIESKPIEIEDISNVIMIHASPIKGLLLMTADGNYWSYDVKTKVSQKIPI